VIAVVVRAGVPVAVKMTPVLRLEVDVDVATHLEVFNARSYILQGIAVALDIDAALVRFVGTLPGALPLSRIAVIDIEPPPFSCSILEFSMLPYCTTGAGHSRVLANAVIGTPRTLEFSIL
jgi:hypothetical protein